MARRILLQSESRAWIALVGQSRPTNHDAPAEKDAADTTDAMKPFRLSTIGAMV